MSDDSASMDCEQALQHLYELLDHELTPELEVLVRDHFEQCRRCFPLYRFETAFKRFLRARTVNLTAPEALRRRVFDQIMLDEDPPQPSHG